MHIVPEIGDLRTFVMRSVVSVYSTTEHLGVPAGSVYATVHPVAPDPRDGRPVAGPPMPLTVEFLRGLADGLGMREVAEILPSNVLTRLHDRIVWYVPPAQRPMFFDSADTPELNRVSGAHFPHPALVFKVVEGHLSVRALRGDPTVDRPTAETPLYVAPYFNTASRTGEVCHGSMRVPDHMSVATLGGWERAFFGSAFTHASAASRLVTGKQGYASFAVRLAGRSSFPAKALVAAGEKLGTFAGAANGR